MDAESLKSLGWMLLFGALFYVMMRHGCGSHMMGGHGGHRRGGHASGGPGAGPVKDPVCGMNVDTATATAASVHAGMTYYFCSTSCRDKFEKEPTKYAAAGGSNGQPQGGQHHG